MLKLALNGGVLSSIWDAIKSIVSFFANFTDILKGIFQATIIYAYSIFYYLFMGICSMVNFAEMLFKKFAGIDPIMTTDGQMKILDVFVKSNEIWGLFVSILILSIVLLFIFTIVAVIKSEFSLDAKGSAKGPIIARSLKSLAMFVIVPVVSLLGVYAVNAITDTINSMMKGSDNTSMVNQIFYTMSYNANKARLNEDFAEFIDGYSADNDGPWANDNGGAFKGSQEDVAYAIDMAFKGNLECKYKYKWISFPLDMIECQDFSTLFMPVIGSRSTYSIWDITQVNLYYSVMDMDYIIGLGSAIVITYMLLSMCVVLIKRIFEIVILLLLAAPMISLAPLDGGSASKSWQKEFIKRVISIVAPVFAINMYFIMIPLFMKISIFGGGLNGLASLGAINLSTVGFGVGTAVAIYATYDAIFQLLAICVGMSVVKTASALLCNLLGIQDLLKDGHEQTKKAVGTAAAVAATVASGGAAAGALVGKMKAGSGAKAAKKDYNAALASGDQSKIDAAKSKLDAANERKSAANDLFKDKGAAMMERVAPDVYKGYKDVKSTLDNRNKTKKQKEDEDEVKAQERKERASATVIENKKQKALKKAHQSQAYAYEQSVAQDKSFDDHGLGHDMDRYVNREETRGQRWAKGGKGEESLAAAKKNYAATQEQVQVGTTMNGTPIYETRTKAGMEGVANKLLQVIQALEGDKNKLTTARQDTKLALDAGDAKGAKFTGNTVKKTDEDGNVSYEATDGKPIAVKKPEVVKTPLDDTASKVGKAIKIGNGVLTLGSGLISTGAVKKVGESMVEDHKLRQGTSDSNYSASEKIASAGDAKGLLAKSEEVKAMAEDKDVNDQMSEGVEKGLKEAAGDLAKAIKEALATGKLPIDGMAKLNAQMEQFTKQFANAKKNDETGEQMKQAIEDLKKALTDMLKK